MDISAGSVLLHSKPHRTVKPFSILWIHCSFIVRAKPDEIIKLNLRSQLFRNQFARCVCIIIRIFIGSPYHKRLPHTDSIAIGLCVLGVVFGHLQIAFNELSEYWIKRFKRSIVRSRMFRMSPYQLYGRIYFYSNWSFRHQKKCFHLFPVTFSLLFFRYLFRERERERKQKTKNQLIPG